MLGEGVMETCFITDLAYHFLVFGWIILCQYDIPPTHYFHTYAKILKSVEFEDAALDTVIGVSEE
jgi:hypothetical protein